MATTPGPLSPRIFRLVRDGDTDGIYGSRSEAVQAVLTASVAAGQSFEWTFALIADPRHVLSEWLRFDYKGRPRSESSGRRQFVRSWRSAVEHVKHGPDYRDRIERALAVVGLADAVDAAPWPGMAGGSDLAVMRAFVAVATKLNSLRFEASVRYLAEMAGVSKTTVSRSLVRLSKAGWVRCIRRSGWGRLNGSLFLLRVPKGAQPGGTFLPTVVESPECPARLLSHDVWSRGGLGLGKSAGRVYEALSREPSTAAGLGRALGISRQAVARQLGRLEEVALAERGVDGWIRGSGSLDHAARVLGQAGRGNIRRGRHELERHQYRERIGRPFDSKPDPVSGLPAEVMAHV